MKKLLTATLCVLMFLSVVACGEEDTQSEKNTSVATATDISSTSSEITEAEVEEDYKSAVSLIKEKKYEEAYTILYKIRNYEKAAKMLKRFIYVPSKLEEIKSSNGFTNKEVFKLAYDKAGRCISKNSTKTRFTYKYNKAGFLVKEIKNIGSDFVTTYTYDDENRLTKVVVSSVYLPEEQVDKYVYDASGLLSAKVSNQSECRYQYNKEGLLIKESYYMQEAVTESNEYVYNDKKALIKKKSTYGKDTAVTEYTYDKDGKILKEVMKYKSNFGGSSVKTVNYTYDNKGNLTEKHSLTETDKTKSGGLMEEEINEKYSDYKIFYKGK